MSATLDYQGLDSFGSKDALCYGEHLSNWPPRMNVLNTAGELVAVKGQISRPGSIHPDTVKASTKRLADLDEAARTGHAGMFADRHGGKLFVCFPDGAYYPFCLPRPHTAFLLLLKRAGQNGVIFSGDHPEVTKNDLRKWVCSLRQLGVSISTCGVNPAERPQKDQFASRYTLHSEVVAVPPVGAVIGDMYALAGALLPTFVENRLERVQHQFARTLQRIKETHFRFSRIGRMTAGSGIEAPARPSAAQKGGMKP